MAASYLWFLPSRLPLAAADLDGDSVAPLTDLAAIRPALSGVLPGLAWDADGRASGESAEGHWLEFSVPDGGTLSMRCSLRADYAAQVQRLCDALGWVAMDERPRLFQPHAEPIDV